MHYCVKNAFNPNSEVQDIENGVFQNAPFANAPFANGRSPNEDYSLLWAMLCPFHVTQFRKTEQNSISTTRPFLYDFSATNNSADGPIFKKSPPESS